MAVRVRLGLLLLLLAVAAAFVPAAGARQNVRAEFATLYVQYTMNCTFTIVDESGKTVSAIPPGAYEVEVSTPIMFKLVNTNNLAPNDFTGCKGWVQFQLTGPGVNLATTLTTGCDANDLFPVETFQPNSTYTAQDNNQPSVAHMTFTTLPAGGAAPVAPAGPYGSGTGKGEASGGSPLGQDVGKTAPLRGTIVGTLSSSGKPTLTSNGAPVTTLRAGRYRFVITDKDPKGGFTIQSVDGVSSTDLTGAGYVGKHTQTITLTRGKWMYYSGLGKASYVVVT
jgi:hypothetical protein